MCLAIPAFITRMDGALATVEVGGVTKQASLVLLPDAIIGDYVLIHAGFAISVVDRQEARDTIKMMRELVEGGPLPPPAIDEPAADEAPGEL